MKEKFQFILGKQYTKDYENFKRTEFKYTARLLNGRYVITWDDNSELNIQSGRATYPVKKVENAIKEGNWEIL